MLIGIDLGNGYCKVAVISVTGEAVILTDSRGQTVIPSCIFWDGTKWLVGAEAANAILAEPDKGAGVGWKRHMGTDKVLLALSDGTEIRSHDMARILLENVKVECEQVLGEPVNECVITVPAIYDDRQKAATLEAAAAAGLNVKKLVPEPSAGFFGSSAHKKGDGKMIIVDFGCGTTDVSVATKSGNNFTTEVVNGAQVGGLDYDDRLTGLVVKRFEEKHGVKLDPEEHAQAFIDLKQRIENLKVSLSSRESASLTISAASKVFSTTVTRNDFEEATSDLTGKIVGLAEKTLKESGTKVEDLREFLLAGGGASIPAIAEAMEKVVGRRPTVVGSPGLAIAKGAALMGRLFLEEMGQTVHVGNVALPPLNIHSRDVTGRSYGVAVLSGETNQVVNSVLLAKGVPIPSDNTRRYRLAQDGQTGCLIEILQGEDNVPREKCLVLGHAELTGLPPVHGAPHNVEIRFRLDRNGMMTATAYDPLCGKSAEVVIEYGSPKPSEDSAA